MVKPLMVMDFKKNISLNIEDQILKRFVYDEYTQMYDVYGGRDQWAYGEGKPYDGEPYDGGCLLCKAVLKHTRFSHRYFVAAFNRGTTAITAGITGRTFLFKDWELIYSLGRENIVGDSYKKDAYDETQSMRNFGDWGTCLLCYRNIRHSFYLHREMHLKCAM
jgi:hypothetical protein